MKNVRRFFSNTCYRNYIIGLIFIKLVGIVLFPIKLAITVVVLISYYSKCTSENRPVTQNDLNVIVSITVKNFVQLELKIADVIKYTFPIIIFEIVYLIFKYNLHI